MNLLRPPLASNVPSICLAAVGEVHIQEMVRSGRKKKLRSKHLIIITIIIIITSIIIIANSRSSGSVISRSGRKNDSGSGCDSGSGSGGG